MATDIQLIYTDLQTGRIARVTDYNPMITPAEMEELTWQTVQYKLMPGPAYQYPNDWEVTLTSSFRKLSGEVTAEVKQRLDELSLRASCLEYISRMINVMRFRRAKHIVGWPNLVPMYLAEIATYRETNVPGTLLSSLVDDITDLPVAIAEFELTNSEYENFLKSTEVLRNKWNRQIKKAEDPGKELDSIRRSMGI